MSFDAIALADLADEVQLRLHVVAVLVLLLQTLVFELCLPDYLLVFDDLPLEVVLIALVALLELFDVLLLQHHSDLALDLAHEVLVSAEGTFRVSLFGLRVRIQLDGGKFGRASHLLLGSSGRHSLYFWQFDSLLFRDVVVLSLELRSFYVFIHNL